MFCIWLLVTLFGFVNANFRPPQKRYWCRNEDSTCQPLNPSNNVKYANEGISIEICRLTCGRYGSLWPKPTGAVSIGSNTAQIDLDYIWFNDLSFMDDMYKISELYKTRWNTLYGRKNGVYKGQSLVVTVNVSKPFQRLRILNTDETYSLRVYSRECNKPFLWSNLTDDIQANISAGSIFAARHALETLSQLMVYDTVSKGLKIACDVAINDGPSFGYRGLLLDVSRNFYPVYSIKHLIDAMSYNKFNVLHLHLTDSHSFPVQINSQPNMTFYGAYGPDKVYTTEDLREIASYAYFRGITVMPEIDAPAHVAYGWQWTEDANLGEILMCLDKECYGSPCGILNPANENTYRILKDIYGELLEAFGDSFEPSGNFFHLGGDEVNFDCWNNSESIQKWLKNQGLPTIIEDNESAFHVWSYFERKAMGLLPEGNQGYKPWTVLWSSKLTAGGRISQYLKDLKDKLVIEFWGSFVTKHLQELLEENVKVIVANSDAWYLDCGVGSWVSEGPNWCAYNDWRKMYNNRFFDNFTNPRQRSQILGGEGCAWSESISAVNMDQRIWPRAAAIAERLWSNPDSCWYFANGRMMSHRDRMVELGVAADTLQPEWCTQNENYCIPNSNQWSKLEITSSCPEFQWSTSSSAKLVQGRSGADIGRGLIKVTALFFTAIHLVAHII